MTGLKERENRRFPVPFRRGQINKLNTVFLQSKKRTPSKRGPNRPGGGKLKGKGREGLTGEGIRQQGCGGGKTVAWMPFRLREKKRGFGPTSFHQGGKKREGPTHNAKGKKKA